MPKLCSKEEAGLMELEGGERSEAEAGNSGETCGWRGEQAQGLGRHLSLI